MNWIKDNYQKLINLAHHQEPWQRDSMSIRRIETEPVSKRDLRKSEAGDSGRYVSGSAIKQETEPVSQSKPVKYQRRDTYPSLLNRAERRFAPTRVIGKVKKD